MPRGEYILKADILKKLIKKLNEPANVCRHTTHYSQYMY